jgi:hypothetical protein
MSEFGSLDLEEMSGESARLNVEPNTGGGGGKRDDKYINIPDPKPGKSIAYPVRVLPPAKGGKLFQYTRLHMLNGRTYQCPKPLNRDGKWDRNTKCTVCDYYNSLYRQRDKLNEQGRAEEAEKVEAEARDIKPIERYYYNAVARKDGDQTNVGPKILSVGKVVHKMIVRAIVGDENTKPIGNVTDLKAGYDLIIMKEMRSTGKKAYPNYDRSDFDRQTSPTGSPEEVKRWSENLHDLTALRNVTDNEVLEKQLAIHRGLIEDDRDGFDVDEFDRKYRPAGSSVAAPVGDVEDRLDATVGSFTEETPVSAPVEDITIEDEDFLKDIEAMTADD